MSVTVGLPFFNAEATLESAIRSVFAQRYPHWELLLMDDGSTDGSLGIARRVRDPRVRVLSDGEHRGLATRLNQLAQQAQYPLLCRMDADDVMHPERLARQVAFLQEHPEVDVVGSAAVEIDSAGRPYGLRRSSTDLGAASALARSPLIHPTVMGRTAWFRSNPYDPAYVRSEDHELWCRTAAQRRIAATDEPLLFYREADRVRLGAYVSSCRTDRRVLRTYGAAAVGPLRTGLLLAGSGAKELLYRSLTPLGAGRWLVRRRGRPLSPAQRAAAERSLAEVGSARVAGLDPGGP